MILTKKTLEEYSKMEQEINRIQRKLDYYTMNPIASTHGMVKGSMKNYPYAEKHFEISAPDVKSDSERNLKIQQLIVSLCEKRKMYEKYELEIDLAIEDIEDLEMRLILQYKYIDRCTDSEIADQLGYERSTITKKLNTFFDVQEHSHNSHFECANMIV